MRLQKTIFLSAAALIALLTPIFSYAVPVATDIVASALTSTIGTVTSDLQTMAFRWLSLFVLAQFLLTNIGMLKSGADIEAVIGKLMGSLLWFGFCFYVVTNGADFIKNVGNGIFDMAGNVAGTPGTFTAQYIFEWGFRLSKTLMNAVNKATGDGWFAKLNFLPSLFTFVSCLVIMLVSGLIGFKIFLVKIELMLTVMMAPLSFSFLGLNALKDQGIAPFKSLISLIYRIMLLAVLVSAMGKVGETLVNIFGAVDQGSVTDVWNPVFAGLLVFSLMGYLAFKSDALAASLSSGSTNLGTSDVASAAAMGAAAGAAAVTGGAAAIAGGASAGGGAGKAAQSMGDFIKSLAGGSSVSNASNRGAAPTQVGMPPQRVNMSLGSDAGTQARNKTPKRDDFVKASNAAQPASSVPTSASSSESETNAGISGPAAIGEQKLDDLAQEMNQPNGKKGALDHLAELNHLVQQEQGTTQVSISTHHSD